MKLNIECMTPLKDLLNKGLRIYTLHNRHKPLNTGAHRSHLVGEYLRIVIAVVYSRHIKLLICSIPLLFVVAMERFVLFLQLA